MAATENAFDASYDRVVALLRGAAHFCIRALGNDERAHFAVYAAASVVVLVALGFAAYALWTHVQGIAAAALDLCRTFGVNMLKITFYALVVLCLFNVLTATAREMHGGATRYVAKPLHSAAETLAASERVTTARSWAAAARAWIVGGGGE